MAILGTTRLKVANGSAAVTKLWNDRYRLEFICDPVSDKTDWYHDNIGGILPDFTASQDDFFGTGVNEGWQAIPESVYPNMVCVEASYPYIPSIGEKRVSLAYETLTDEWVQEKDDTIDYELNGLKRVSRVSVALPGTAYSSVVGDTTINSDGVTVYLGKYQIDETDAKWTLTETWLEAGTLSVSKASESDGVMKVTTVFFGIEGTVIGPIIAKKTDNFEGFQTISVTTLQDVDGNSIIGDGENLVNQVSGLSPFTYPGVLNVDATETENSGGGDWLKVQALLIDAPAQCKVKTTTYFIFQDSNSIVDSDYTYAGASGLWSPNHWAAFYIDAEGTFDDGLFTDSSTFRGYRTSSEGKSGTLFGPLLSDAQLSWQGQHVLIDVESIIYDLTIDQGPPDPIGNTYTLDVQINPAFDDIDGNQYYKKTIIVTDAIPTQPNLASLPYT